jgi:hypothetical protein
VHRRLGARWGLRLQLHPQHPARNAPPENILPMYEPTRRV